MKNIPLMAALALATVLAVPAQGQGFVNLDFESAQVIPLDRFDIAVTNALPGWTVFYGTQQQTTVGYNTSPSPGVVIQATNGFVISGNFSVVLQGINSTTAISIAQTGLVPVSAETLIFEMKGIPNDQQGNVLQVSLGGQNLSYYALANGPNYNLYGADISSFAGQTEALTFSGFSPGTFGVPWTIDDIQFSSQPIPEPSVLGLTALGALLLGFRRWQNSL